MRLFINGRFLTQRVTGVQRYAIEIVKCMDKILNEDDEVTILLPNEPQVTFLELKKIRQEKIGKLKGHLWIQVSLPYYVRKHNGHLLTFSGTAPVISPEFWTVHDITFIRHPESFDWKFRVIYYIAFRIGLKRCKKIFTVSEFSKTEISEYFNISKDKITVAYSSADYLLDKEWPMVDFSAFGVKNNDYYLSVSSRNLHKNQLFVEKLAYKYPDKKFVIVGGEAKSFNSVKIENIKNLIYTGYVNDETLMALYKNAKGFIFPSLYEGFGMPPLEALIAGCKSIALSNIPVFRELYFDSAYFFDPNDVNSFSFEEFDDMDVSTDIISSYIDKYSFKKDATIYFNCICNYNAE